MDYSIYLRPINIDDANVSYQWRNNPLVWQFTKFKPTNYITRAIETAWLAKVLKIKNDFRFAICLKENNQYLGNIQLINVKHKSACLHLFIGDPLLWGKGIGKEATGLLLEYGFKTLGLRCIMLEVHKDNLSAQRIYQKTGFQAFNKRGDFIGMTITRKHYDERQMVIQGNEENHNGQVLMSPAYRQM
ncbi:MAG TPA: GNAT family N-acetyltransferase [Sphingobacteriaceae bacterium]